MLALLYLPIGILFLFSFSTDTSLRFPIQGLTLDRYASAIGDGALLEAARNSFVVASRVGHHRLGAGLAWWRLQCCASGSRAGRFCSPLPACPLVVPFVVMGVAFFLLFVTLDLPRSLLTVTIGHATCSIPYATLIILARLGGLDPALEDAAMDLGASYPTTLRRVVLPLIGPTLLSAWLTSFILSFDEIALAIFLVGGDPTFPVFLYGQLRFAQRLPMLIAMAVLLMVGTVLLTMVALRLRGRSGD